MPAPRRALLVCALLAACTSLAACAEPEGTSATLQVVTGFYPLQFVTEQVGGDRVAVTTLAQPGAEPHDLELSPRQVAEISDADLVVYLRGFQPAVDEAVPETEVLDAATVVPLLRGVDHVHQGEESAPEGVPDPHLWLDPTRLAAVADAVAERLAAADPDGAAGYRERAQSLRSGLTELDQEYEAGLRTCDRRELVVSHAAFGYLADRYRLEQIAITGLTPETEPTPQRMAEVIHEARDHAATTIFFETLVSPRVAEAIASEVGAATAVLDPIEGLPVGSSDDYVSVMRANLSTLRTALGCS